MSSSAAAPPRFGGQAEVCPVCSEKVYPLDRFVIEKMVIHKACFKCKHCAGKLSLSNFAAVNQQVYCKTHYLQLFRESGGRYDKAFGDGGFEKKSTTQGYVPGQFRGVNAPTTPPSAAATSSANTSVVLDEPATSSPAAAPAAVAATTTTTPPNVKEMMKRFNEPASPAGSAAAGGSGAAGSTSPAAAAGGGGSGSKVKDMMRRFQKDESGAASSSSSPSKDDDSPHKPTGGQSLSERIKQYSANAASSSSSSFVEDDVEEVEQQPGKLGDRLQQYVVAAATHKESAAVEEEEEPAEEAEEPAEETAVAVEEEPAAVAEEEPAAVAEEETAAPVAEEETAAPVAEEEPAVQEEEEPEEEPVAAAEEEPVEEAAIEEQPASPIAEEEPVAAAAEEEPVEEAAAEDEEPTAAEAEPTAAVTEEPQQDDDSAAPQTLFTPVKDRAASSNQEEEQEDLPPPPSIIKLGEGFRTPSVDRSVRFGAAVEVIEEEEEDFSTPDGQQQQRRASSTSSTSGNYNEEEDELYAEADAAGRSDSAAAGADGDEEGEEHYTPVERVRSSSGHSATKGSALALYLNMMDEQKRHQRQPNLGEMRSPTPPPPILSPGSHYAPHLQHHTLSAALAAAARGPLAVGAALPDVHLEGGEGEGEGEVLDMRLHEYFAMGAWGVLLSVELGAACATTELRVLRDLYDEFESRSCKLLVAVVSDSSTSTLTTLQAWKQEIGGDLPFPLVRANAELAQALGSGSSGLVVVAPDRRIKLSVQYPSTTGRNLPDVVRALDSLQLSHRHQHHHQPVHALWLGTPAGWTPGQDCLVLGAAPAEGEDGEEEGVRTVALPSTKPYLRFTSSATTAATAHGDDEETDLPERHVSFSSAAGAGASVGDAAGAGAALPSSSMGLVLGDELPNFEASSTSLGRVKFHSLFESGDAEDGNGDQWVVVLAQPGDFTPVATTELALAAQLQAEFASRKCQVVILSPASLDVHLDWIDDVEAYLGGDGGGESFPYPILADASRDIAGKLGLSSHAAGGSATALVCGPDRRLKLMSSYTSTTGRSLDELLRAIDSLQLTAQGKPGTLANWLPGQPCLEE